MSRSKNKHNNSLSSWILPIVVLMILPPAGMVWIVLKLLSGNPVVAKDRQDEQIPFGARTTAHTGQTTQSKLLSKMTSKGKRLTTIGIILTVLFGLCSLTMLSDSLYWLIEGDVTWFLQELVNLLPMLCFTGGGLGCLWAGLRKKKQVARYRSYLAMVGRRPSISVSALASATGLPAAKVRDDLEDMLEEGLFPAGFLNYGGDMLVLSGEGLQEEAPKPKAKPAPKRGEENAILAEIRAVNNAISNEKLSSQIDRIGIITAKILDYQKSHPEKSPQLHSFLSYYLPTTLKILRAYGQLEAQEVSGQNITAAMERIEGMMDKVVEGFEKQLDQLFQGDAMDITTDVEVLERMLAKDGLSGRQGMTLGL